MSFTAADAANRPPTSAAVRLLFCGADQDWDRGAQHEMRRRHLFFLQAFIAAPEIDRVYVFQRLSRFAFLRRRWSSRRRDEGRGTPQATPVDVVRWLPERPWLPLTAAWNRALARWLVRRRLPPSPGVTVVWCYALRGMALADDLDLEGEWLVDTDHDLLHDENRRSLPFCEAEALLLRCARRARRVFSASRNMLRWLAVNGIANGQRLRNGSSPRRFDSLPAERRAADCPAPVLGYVGVLSPWIDFEVLIELAGRRPDWRFVVAGGWYRMRPLAELEELVNVDLRGAVSAAEVPELLAGFDVGLGLYRREPWLDVDSMKIYEYLAAGLPAVSTPFHPDLSQDFEGLVSVADDASGFEAEVLRILALTEPERRHFQARCRDFVARNSWETRTREALDAICSHA